MASLDSVPNLRRVYDAYAVVRSCGLNAATLISAITNAPTPDTVSALQSALRARYATADWLTAVRPVNDAVRVMQRDALVAYILQQLGDGYTAPVITLPPPRRMPRPGRPRSSCGSLAGVVPGMAVTGTGVAPGATVIWAGPGAISISTGLAADLPSGSALSVSPTGNPFDTPDSLLEYFLVDVETQPPVQTSRIRLALSQVQLFIERVLLSLEPAVSAADIDAARWEWMKRYRVWEANRLVFLEPENWLYPELRDNQSPFFQQMMSSLLQGDITDDAAASAYLDYLTSLEEVAKLEPCGLVLPARQRRCERDQLCRGADRRGEPQILLPPVPGWRLDTVDPGHDRLRRHAGHADRLERPPVPLLAQGGQAGPGHPGPDQHQPAQQRSAASQVTDLNSSVTTATGNAPTGSVLGQAVLCWTEYYNSKWQPTKTSDINLPTTIGSFDQTGPGSFEAIRDSLIMVPAQFTGTSPNLQNDASYDFSIPPDALILPIVIDAVSKNHPTAGSSCTTPIAFQYGSMT